MTLAPPPSGWRPGQLLPLPPCCATDYLLQDFGAPPPNATILNNLNDREGASLFFYRIYAPPMPHPPTPQYLTILMTEKGGAIMFYRILVPPPPSPDATILITILMTERERYYFCRILAPPMPPLHRGHNT